MGYFSELQINMVESVTNFVYEYDPYLDIIYKFTLRYKDWDFVEICEEVNDDKVELYCLIEDIINTEEDYFYYALKDIVEEERLFAKVFKSEQQQQKIDDALKCMKYFECLIPEGDRI